MKLCADMVEIYKQGELLCIMPLLSEEPSQQLIDAPNWSWRHTCQLVVRKKQTKKEKV